MLALNTPLKDIHYKGAQKFGVACTKVAREVCTFPVKGSIPFDSTKFVRLLTSSGLPQARWVHGIKIPSREQQFIEKNYAR